MVRDYSPRRPHRSEDLDSRARPSQSSRRGYDDPPHRDSRYAERERDRDRDKDRDRYGDRRRDERHRERDRDRDEPRASRARDDYSRDYPSRSERDRRGRDRDERDTRERRRDTSRGGPSRRSASPPPRAAPSRSRSAVSRSKSPEDKAKPNFAPSGLLAAATKTVEHKDGTKTVLKYHEPPEARKPVVGWRLYVFKGQEQVGASLCVYMRFAILTPTYADLLHIHRQSAYLIGRDRLVADIPIEHPSCSKQHAVIQCMCALPYTRILGTD